MTLDGFDEGRTKRSFWHGKDLTPLPSESLFSILARLAWYNAVGHKEIYRQIMGQSNVAWNHSFNSKMWNLSTLLPDELSWTLGELGCIFAKTFYPSQDLFLEKRLRICPLCFEQGYHSPWHQFLPVRYCKMHNCLLTTYCASCGRHLPLYQIKQALTDRPYQCAECNGWIAGASPVLQAHIEYRSHAIEIARHFKEYDNWLVSAAPMFQRIFGGSNSYYRYLRMYESKITFPEIPHLCKKLLPFPSDHFEFAPQMTILSWRVRTFSTTRAFRTHYARKSRKKMACNVYQATLEMLRKWLLLKLEKDVYRKCWNKFHCHPDVLKNWDTAHLAYILLRERFERHPNVSLLSSTEPISLDFFSNRGEVRLASFEGRELRLQWRALILAYYSYLYHLILEWRKLGKFDFSVHIREFIYASLNNNFVEENKSITGYTVFRSVPGMPCKPFGTDAKNEQRMRELGAAPLLSPLDDNIDLFRI